MNAQDVLSMPIDFKQQKLGILLKHFSGGIFLISLELFV